MRFYHLMSLVCEDLPSNTVDTLVRGGHEATTEQLRAVRQCRKVYLPWLIDLVKTGLPKYEIPAEVLPVPTPAPLLTWWKRRPPTPPRPPKAPATWPGQLVARWLAPAPFHKVQQVKLL